MSVGEDKPKGPAAGGTMADHLKRYRDYIGDLKKGSSSGISAAFGRASDLLPPEVMEIKAPPVSPPTADPAELGQNVLAAEYDRAHLRQTLETLIKDYADGVEDPVGSLVKTVTGEEEVLSVYVENGVRMYMLSDLSVIDENTFADTLIRPAAAATQRAAVPAGRAAEALAPPESGRQTRTDFTSPPQPDMYAASESALPPQLPPPMQAPPSPWADAFDQTVAAADGAMLWQINYDAEGPAEVSMADGGLIRRAEGRREFIFSKHSQGDDAAKFFILSGLVVDPATGNVYLEANEGAYTAAFLNNGWQIHQYRDHNGVETYFVTEPMPAVGVPTTRQVRSLNLDLAAGAVSYESLDSSASITLKSRKI